MELIRPDTHATFLPGASGGGPRLFVWPQEFGVDELELVVMSPDGPQVRSVTGVAHAFSDVLDELVQIGIDAPVTRSVRAWAEVARVALRLVASGRIQPAVEDGRDVWVAGPLTPQDRSVQAALAGWLPPEAHCVPVGDGQSTRMLSPGLAVSGFSSAVIDVMPRTEAAGLVSGQAAWSGQWTSDVSDLVRYLPDAVDTPEIVVGVRLVMPESNDEPFVVEARVRSGDDSSLSAAAAELWAGSAAGFGPEAETALLVGLRRASRVWPVLGRMLDGPEPTEIELVDDEPMDLFGPIGADLVLAGIEVELPVEITRGLTTKAQVAGPPRSGDASPQFGLDSLCELSWSASIDGTPLTEAEIAQLTATQRPLVKLRGQWIVADPEVLSRLHESRQLTGAEALGAALSGSTLVGGSEVELVAVGPLADLVTRLAFAAHPHDRPEPPGLVAELRPYQKRGLAWLVDMTMLGLGGVLADDMGLGKTVQFIALHLHLMAEGLLAGPTLVVCPASVVGNWQRELARFAPGLTVHRYHGADRALDGVADGDVVITTYGLARRDQHELSQRRWGLVAADEAQQIKNPNAAVSKAMRRIPAGARVGLTGTPVENRLTELWSLLDWTTPGLLGPVEAFRRSVAIPIERDGNTEVTERFSRVVSPFLLRRRKDDPEIAPDLPPKTETDHPVQLTAEQAGLYTAVVDEVLESVRSADGIERRGLVLKLLTALKQVCNHPAHYLHQSGPLSGRSGKLDAFTDLVAAIADAGDSTLVFTQYVKMGELLMEELARLGLGAEFLHGSLSVTQRDLMVERFQAGKFGVFVISLRAGGVGLNLTKATHVIHYDRWWNPAVENQASDRAWRIGQDRPVQVHRLICEGTLEERIAEVLAAKAALAEAVVGSGESWLTELDDDELADLIGLSATEGS